MIRVAGALEERIKADTVVALKAGDKQRTQALRLLTAALKKERIDAGKTPDEAAEIVVLKRERKRRLEAAELYESTLRSLGDDDGIAEFLWSRFEDAQRRGHRDSLASMVGSDAADTTAESWPS